VCLSYEWLSLGGAESVEAGQDLADIGVDRVVGLLEPGRQGLVRQGIIFSLLRRDSRLLARSIALMLEATHFKRHKSLLFQLDKLLYSGAPFLRAAFGIRGLKIIVSGKISVGGNSKKRRVSIDMGGSSYSTKQVRLSLTRAQARTPVGVLGVLVVISA
jgi:hypothetical protein